LVAGKKLCDRKALNDSELEIKYLSNYYTVAACAGSSHFSPKNQAGALDATTGGRLVNHFFGFS